MNINIKLNIGIAKSIDRLGSKDRKPSFIECARLHFFLSQETSNDLVIGEMYSMPTWPNDLPLEQKEGKWIVGTLALLLETKIIFTF